MTDGADEALAARAQGGDPAAYEALVRRYLRPALAVALEFTGVREDAEDVVQDAFHRTVRALDRYDPTRPFRPWFFTILRNVARNHIRARHRWDAEVVDPDLPDRPADPLRALERKEVWSRVAIGMETLSPMQQTCFRLVDVEGFGGSEVAQMLDVAESTVRVHLHRARRTLRAFLESVREERLRP